MKKKFLKIIIALFVLIVVIVGGFIIFNKTTKTTFESLDKTDQLMLTRLSKMQTIFREQHNNIWPDYRFDKKPLILVPVSKERGVWFDHVFVVNIPNVSNRLTAKKIEMPAEMNLPPVYRVSWVDLNLLRIHIPGDFANEISKAQFNDEKTFWFKYHPTMMRNPSRYADFDSYLIHEGVHFFMQEDWQYDKNGDAIENYPHHPEQYALMGIEFQLLDEARKATDKQKVEESLKKWTIVRTMRYRQWPQLAGETKAEAIEGTARYVEYRYAKLANINSDVLVGEGGRVYTFSEGFQLVADGKAKTTVLNRNIRYETGSALELLFDKLDLNWKEKITSSPSKQGENQYEILKRYFKVDELADIAKELDEIKKQYDYDAAYAKAEKIVEKTKK